MESKKGKYEVSVPSGGKVVYGNTIAEMKTKGLKLAKSVAWKGKWNLMYLTFSIMTSKNGWYWTRTGWQMAVPVRGTGKTADYIIDAIKRREGVAPFVWFKKK